LVRYRNTPTTMSPSIITMKKYVGTEKILPDSRTPRRFPIMRIATKPIPIVTRWSCRAGTAEVSAATPAATLTETVSV